MEYVVLVVVAVLGLIVVSILKPRPEVVREEERLVIYRLGLFQDVVGPGLVFRWGRVETIERRLNARNEPFSCLLDGLLVYGVPIGLTINLWSRFDPKAAVGQDKELLKYVTFLTDSERQQQMELKVVEVVMQVLSALQRGQKLPDNPTLVDKILPVIPHGPMAEKLVEEMIQPLTKAFATLGVMLDMRHPIAIVRLHLTSEVTAGFSRDRTLELLQRRVRLPDDRLLQMVGAIEGWSDVDVREIGLRGTAAGTVEERMTDGKEKIQIPLAQTGRPQANKAEQPEASTPTAEAMQRLSKTDLEVLKRVPRRAQGQKTGS